MRIALLTWALGALAALGATGCIGAPFVTPPIRTSITLEALTNPLPRGGSTVTHVQIAVHPASLIPSVADRPLDVGVGYGFLANDGYLLHAPYAEFDVLPLTWRLGTTTLARVGTAIQPALLFEEDGASAGWGGGAQLFLEIEDWVSGPFESSSSTGGVVGAGAGELGIGLHLQTFAMRYHEATSWGVGFGVNLRLPASIGFAWAAGLR